MNTQTPTSDLIHLQGVPSGMVGERELETWVSQMLAALPGNQTAMPTPASAAPAATLAAVASPSVGEMPQPRGLPETASHGAPSFTGTHSAWSQAEPAAYMATVRETEPVKEVRPYAPEPDTSPYYFLGEANSRLAAPGDALSHPIEQLDAGKYGLPSQQDLQVLLQDEVQPHAAPAYYFVDLPKVEDARITTHSVAHPPFDVNFIRRDFPILAERVNGKPLVWLDNAATTQKPQAVIDRLSYFYQHENSNIHRAAHELAARATDAYESARKTVARFIGASSAEEIIFVRGATEGINLIAKTWGAQYIGPGDEIVVSHLEHHANIVPWQQLAAEKGARLRVIPVDDSGQILLDEYRRLLSDRTKLVSVTHVSNALGTVTPVGEMIAMAHSVGAKVLIDGAQSVSHMRVDVRALDADFFVFSGHKIFAPTGIGAVYGKRDVLETMPPWQGGGNMIADVTFERTVYQAPPHRFEAGTGNLADAVGLGAALEYLERIGMENIARYEHELLIYAMQRMQTIPGLRLIGTAKEKASVLSFVLAGYKTEEVGAALNQEGIAVRSGHHCAQPILRRFGLEATVRPSLAFYNTCAEIDAMHDVLKHLANHAKR